MAARLILLGGGSVGVAAAQAAREAGLVEVVAVVDPDEAARRRAARELAADGYLAMHDVPSADLEVALIAFGSRADAVAVAVRRLLEKGCHVVTTCEELADPAPQLRSALDDAARLAERCVVATGANPGFVMDRLPLLLATASHNVTRVEALRRVDTRARRGSLVVKSGRGLSPAEFAAGVAEGRIGHVGMPECARLVAEGLGWDDGAVDTAIEPVLDERGTVAGLHQLAHLAASGREVVLDLTMAWGAEAVDVVTITGEPPLRVEIHGGYHGDLGTSAGVVAALRRLPDLPPGFYRPTDLPLSLRR